MIVVSVLCSTVKLVYAQDAFASSFLASHSTLTKAQEKTVVVVAVAGAGGLFAATSAATIDEIFLQRLLWRRTVNKYNRFSEEVRRIGMPRELVEYFGSLPSYERYTSKALRSLPTGYSFEEGLAFQRLLKQIKNAKSRFHTTQELFLKLDKTKQKVRKFGAKDSFSDSAKGVQEYISETLKSLKNFRGTYPNLAYTHEYGWHIPTSYSFARQQWMLTRVEAWQVKDGIMTEGKYKGMPVERRLTSDGEDYIIRLTPRAKALQRRNLKQLTKLGKAAKMAVPLVALGAALEAAAAPQQQDMEIAQKLLENPELAFGLTEEEAAYIEAHASKFPRTIETYNQYAQAVKAFEELDAQQQEQLVQEAQAILEEEAANAAEIDTAQAREKLVRSLQQKAY